MNSATAYDFKLPKKFALIGTSCVGKTTILNLLPKKLQEVFPNKKIVVVEEAARLYFSMRKTKNPFSHHHQKNIQFLAKKLERKTLKQFPDIVICDRSVIDAIAYRHAVSKMDKKLQFLIKRIKPWLSSYHHFFLLDPNGVPYKTDNIRQESLNTRMHFHDSFVSVLSMLPISYTLISDLTVEKRVQSIVRIIKHYG